MSSSFSSSLAAVVLIFAPLPPSHPAKADTYKLTVVDVSQTDSFQGIDDKGDFVINASSIKCGAQMGAPCFEVFAFGQPSFFTTTAPVLNFDNGVPCTVPVSPALGQPTASGMCNNGHEILSILTPAPG